VTGVQFAASLVGRIWSGRICDRDGPKFAIRVGAVTAAVAGALYGLSGAAVTMPNLSVVILLVGRAALGVAESFIVTGTTIWATARIGPDKTGRILAAIGTAMFAALAIGAPLGSAMYGAGRLYGLGSATLAVGIAIAMIIKPMIDLHRPGASHASAAPIIAAIWRPGLGAALGSVGFGALATFSALLFSENHWLPVWLPVTIYSTALVSTRLLVSHLPDLCGGARVAAVSVCIEAIGLLTLGLASSPWTAGFGAALTGIGYALVFPSFGVEAIRRSGDARRGLAMGMFTASVDLALGVTSPLLGAIVVATNLHVVFVFGSLIVACAAPIAIWVNRSNRTGF
jgi:MFS family permease